MQAIYNKQAGFDYEILDKYEAGIVLSGAEVKSVKAGQMDLKSSYISLKRLPKPEMFLINAHIAPYKQAGKQTNYEPKRSRKLLLTKREINSMAGKLDQNGLTIVPLKVYTVRNLVKIEIGLSKGKKQFEKRERIKKKDVEREIRRMLKNRNP